MISLRARLVKAVLSLTVGKKKFNPVDLPGQRRQYDKNLRFFFRPPKWARVEAKQIANSGVVTITTPESTERTVVYIHGGGFVFGSAASSEQFAAQIAENCQAKVISIDYPLAPERPYPEGLDAIVNIWKQLLADGLDPKKTAILGDSAGGNLALAAALRFREAKIAQPACLVLLSPGLDATFSGESHKTARDPVLNTNRTHHFMQAYTGDKKRDDPIVSPVFADLKNLPPMLVHVGSDELLRSDSERLAQNAGRDGADLTLHVAAGMWHVWHLYGWFVPEAKLAMKEVGEFVRSRT